MRYKGGTSGSVNSISVGMWMTTLMPYLSVARPLYFCPNDYEYTLNAPTVDAFYLEAKDTGAQIYLKEGPWTKKFKYPSLDWDKFVANHETAVWNFREDHRLRPERQSTIVQRLRDSVRGRRDLRLLEHLHSRRSLPGQDHLYVPVVQRSWVQLPTEGPRGERDRREFCGGNVF